MADDFRIYRVRRRDKTPLLQFILDALREAGCRILFASEPDEAPFRITFESPTEERIGIIVYAFLANRRMTKHRPSDEHRLQVKYESKDGALHELWQDPYGLYTTLFCGISIEDGYFVGVDPVLHSPTKFFVSIEFKQHHVDTVLADGWATWERDRRRGDDRPIEVLVGGRPEEFLRYIAFERHAAGEDQGHRQLLAERLPPTLVAATTISSVTASPSHESLHRLAVEFQLREAEVLDLIEAAPRLKMAVRGWVAEEHLYRQIATLPEVTGCERLEADQGPDIALQFRGVPLTIECKNVLRHRSADGLARIDFQRTRASKADPCSRYYAPDEFDIVGACLHAVTESWEFRYVTSRDLDPHQRCDGKLASNVRVDRRWADDARTVFSRAAALRSASA